MTWYRRPLVRNESTNALKMMKFIVAIATSGGKLIFALNHCGVDCLLVDGVIQFLSLQTF